MWRVSSSSDPREDLAIPFEVPDKVAHAVEFAVGGWLVRAALRLSGAARATSAAVVACAAWGFLDEIHQGHVPGRTTDPWDLAADVTGATAGALLHAFLSREPRTPARPSR